MISGLPPKVICANQTEARQRAGLDYMSILGTGSMAPYIPASGPGEDPLTTIVAYAKYGNLPYSSIQQGNLVVYHPAWAVGFIIHQAAQRDSGGWIMSGLNNPRSEAFYRVTEKDFHSIVDTLYTWNR